jgi:hypothetical protein
VVQQRGARVVAEVDAGRVLQPEDGSGEPYDEALDVRLQCLDRLVVDLRSWRP